MTLVLTELSEVGIAMAADSAITRVSRGKIVEIDQQGWCKPSMLLWQDAPAVGHIIIGVILKCVRAGCARRRGRRWGDSETRKPLRQPIQLIHQPINLPVGGLDLPLIELLVGRGGGSGQRSVTLSISRCAV